jgi:hypothetical protein
MSLDFSYKDCKNTGRFNDPADPEAWNPVAANMPWMMLGIGMNAITPKNVDDVKQRVRAYQVVNGPFLRTGKGPVYLLDSDIDEFVGMRTNITQMTRAAFTKTLGEMALDQARHANWTIEGRPDFQAKSALDTLWEGK